MNASELNAEIAKRVGKLNNPLTPDGTLKTGLVKTVLETFQDVVKDELAAGREVRITNFVKFTFRKVKAIKKGTMVRNPITGGEQPHAGRPAQIQGKVMALKGLKAAAPEATTKAGKAILSK